MRIEAGSVIMAANPKAGRALVPVTAVSDPGHDRGSQDRGPYGRQATGSGPDPRLPRGRLFAPIVAQILSGREPNAGSSPRRPAGNQEAVRAYGDALLRTQRLPAGTMLARSF